MNNKVIIFRIMKHGIGIRWDKKERKMLRKRRDKQKTLLRIVVN